MLTDLTYFGNVHYSELMNFCYVWLCRLVGNTVEAFTSPSSRNASELTGNVTMDRDLCHVTIGLAEVFCRMTHALQPGALRIHLPSQYRGEKELFEVCNLNVS